jgi:hypothetical protein
MTTESLLERLAELGLEKFDPARKQARASKRDSRADKHEDQSNPKVPKSSVTSAAEVKRTRYVVAHQRHHVADDGHGCTFVTAQGHRCGSRKFLQLDHVTPFAKGGPNTAENLRWMCGAHNRYRASCH